MIFSTRARRSRLLPLVLLALALPVFGGEPKPYDAFVHSSPEEQVEALGRATREEQLEMMRALKATIETDPLTGLRNRRSLHSMRGGAAKPGAVISFISFDLDHFKKINDTYGHDVGDEVLTRVSEIARENTRDPVFRLGGEEFLVILPGVTAEVAHTIAERLRQALESARFDKHEALRISGSFGVATGESKSHHMWDALIKASDEASYAAKQGGRNQVRVADPMRACELLASGQE